MSNKDITAINLAHEATVAAVEATPEFHAYRDELIQFVGTGSGAEGLRRARDVLASLGHDQDWPASAMMKALRRSEAYPAEPTAEEAGRYAMALDSLLYTFFEHRAR